MAAPPKHLWHPNEWIRRATAATIVTQYDAVDPIISGHRVTIKITIAVIPSHQLLNIICTSVDWIRIDG